MILLRKKEESWINIAKACAVVGVVLQHVYGYIYTNKTVLYSVYWVVALFVMLGATM